VRVEFLDEADEAIDRDPHHHLRVHEVAAPAADLPDPVVGALPRGRQELHQLEPRPDPGFLLGQTEPARLVERLEHLAVDIELELLARGVADPYRPRLLVTG